MVVELERNQTLQSSSGNWAVCEAGMPTVLITTFPADFASGETRSMLEEAGCEVRFRYPRGRPSEDEMIELLRGLSALIAGNSPLTERVLRSASGLKVIAHTGDGVESVDLRAAQTWDTRVTVTPGLTSVAVAEIMAAAGFDRLLIDT